MGGAISGAGGPESGGLLSVRKEAEPRGTNQQAALLHGLEVLERIWILKESEYF